MNDVFEVDDDEDDITKLKIPLGNKEIIQKKNTGVFTINANISIMKPLDEEYEKDAIEIKKKYKESHNNNWIQKIFKNENYEIIDNEGGGNCFICQHFA